MTLIGENGILTQASKAKTETTKSGTLEKVQLEVLGSYETDGSLDNGLLKTNLNNINGIQGVPDTIEDTSFPLTVTVDGVKIDIRKDGTVKYAFDAEEWDKTATPEDCFIWESDTVGEEGYNIITGYTEKLELYTKLIIPSRCTKIKVNASSDNGDSRRFCSSVRTIELPSTVVDIGDWAFAGKDSYGFGDLESVTIPESVTHIGKNAFHYCTSLRSITIPSSVTSMSGYVFGNWTSSQTINIQEYTSTTLPAGWSNSWNSNCSANINWGQ